MLSVILPLRVTPRTTYLLARLEANLAFLAAHEGVECVVVDSGSDPRYRPTIERACRRPGCELVADPAPQTPFAPGMARNAGAEAASGDVLFFYDVDLVCPPDLVARILAWAREPREPAAFAMVPCLYLTRTGTERLGVHGGAAELGPHLDSALRGENELVGHFAVSTSTLAVAREHFLALGGNRPAYRGHGCEDFDLLHRLASYWPVGARDDDYYEDHKTRFVGDYRGFRAYLARYGIDSLFSGLYTAHLWHPRPLQLSYFRRRGANEELLQRLMREHDQRGPRGALPAPWTGADRVLPGLRAQLTSAMAEHGYDAAEFPGLFRWKEGVTQAAGTPRRKLRKLLLRPRAFFADSRVPALRALARVFRR